MRRWNDWRVKKQNLVKKPQSLRPNQQTHWSDLHPIPFRHWSTMCFYLTCAKSLHWFSSLSLCFDQNVTLSKGSSQSSFSSVNKSSMYNLSWSTSDLVFKQVGKPNFYTDWNDTRTQRLTASKIENPMKPAIMTLENTQHMLLHLNCLFNWMSFVWRKRTVR